MLGAARSRNPDGTFRRPAEGDQRPRIWSVPDYVSSSGPEAVELAAMAGLILDDWQAWELTQALGERPDGKWAAKEVADVVCRQNGKGGLLEARELAGLFLLGERLIVHTAHQFDTSLEGFRRLLFLIENTPDLDCLVKRVSKSHGEEGIELMSGQRIRFRTRTGGGGRGFTGDCLILDEAMILPESMIGAVFPTLRARPNPQVWYTGSAVDAEVHEHGIVLARIRERGIAGDPDLAYFEHSADAAEYAKNPQKVATDRQAWAQANPGLGIRIDPEWMALEQRSMPPRKFAVECLGIGYWPRTDVDGDRVISADEWHACADPDSHRDEKPPTFAVDVTPARDKGSIAAAGRRPDGRLHVEVVENLSGTGWLVALCGVVQKKYPKSRFVVDPRGPAAGFIPDLKRARVRVAEVSTAQYGQACGELKDAVVQDRLRYPDPQPEIDTALAAAVKRPLGDAWAWDRKNLADLSPLVAATLAVWGVQNLKPPAPQAINLATLGRKDAQTPEKSPQTGD